VDAAAAALRAGVRGIRRRVAPLCGRRGRLAPLFPRFGQRRRSRKHSTHQATYDPFGIIIVACCVDACGYAGVCPKRGTERRERGPPPHEGRNRGAEIPAHPCPQSGGRKHPPRIAFAAALALSHEPTFDEGTAQRIREAALSYADLAIRGGWPMIPAEAKFALGMAGPIDDLLRQRLILSDDLAPTRHRGH